MANATYIPLTGVGGWLGDNANFRFGIWVMQILVLSNAKIYQNVGISNAKFWRWGHCPTPTPDARYFASQWNIGFSLLLTSVVLDLVPAELKTEEPLYGKLKKKKEKHNFFLLLMYSQSHDPNNIDQKIFWVNIIGIMLNLHCKVGTKSSSKQYLQDKVLNIPYCCGICEWDTLPHQVQFLSTESKF